MLNSRLPTTTNLTDFPKTHRIPSPTEQPSPKEINYNLIKQTEAYTSGGEQKNETQTETNPISDITKLFRLGF